MTESDIFKSRSTAMAIETDQFRRDDLYTLFITARIINFLKGLRLTGEKVSLQDALKQAESAGHREKLGAQLLRSCWTRDGFTPATKGGFEALPDSRLISFWKFGRNTGRCALWTAPGSTCKTAVKKPLDPGSPC